MKNLIFVLLSLFVVLGLSLIAGALLASRRKYNFSLLVIGGVISFILSNVFIEDGCGYKSATFFILAVCAAAAASIITVCTAVDDGLVFFQTVAGVFALMSAVFVGIGISNIFIWLDVMNVIHLIVGYFFLLLVGMSIIIYSSRRKNKILQG